MANLQKEIVDERRGQYIKTIGPTSVGSTGTFGLKAGISPDLGSSPTIVGSDPFPPSPNQQAINRPSWAQILRSTAGFVAGYSFSDSIQNIQPPRAEVEVGRSVTSPFRKQEIEWRRTHAEILKSFENEWVVLEGEKIIAHGDDPVHVIDEARSKGVRTPYIFFVEPQSEDIASIGL